MYACNIHLEHTFGDSVASGHMLGHHLTIKLSKGWMAWVIAWYAIWAQVYFTTFSCYNISYVIVVYKISSHMGVDPINVGLPPPRERNIVYNHYTKYHLLGCRKCFSILKSYGWENTHTHNYFKFFFFFFFSCFSILRSYGFINSGDGFKWMVISISIVGGIFYKSDWKKYFIILINLEEFSLTHYRQSISYFF